MREREWEEGVGKGLHLEGDGLGLACPHGGSVLRREYAGMAEWQGRRWEVEELWLLIGLGGLTRGAGLSLGVLALEGGLSGFEAACQVLVLGVEVLPRALCLRAGLVSGRVVGEADILGVITLRSVPTRRGAVAVPWSSRWSALAVTGRLLRLGPAVISTFSRWSSGAGS